MKIAIAGYGMEGESSYRYWASDENNVITIVDEHQPTRAIPSGVETIIGEGAFSKLDDFDLVIRTAGLSPDKIKTNGKIWSATNEFFEICPTKIIGVTGTKGKGTIASLIASILEASGKKVWLVGNIGISALDALDRIGSEDIIVYELSSFQLWDLQKSPTTAVVGMIEVDHLNIHKDMDDYVNAKRNIRLHQTDDDICIYHPTNHYSKEIALSTNKGKAFRYGISDDGGVYERDGEFIQNGEIICSTDLLQLIGYHNVENACAAISVAREYGANIDAIEDGLKSFKGLPHRLQFVREVDGRSYYDDSIATTPGSAIAALRSFDQPKTIILGGSSKGTDFTELVNEILKHQVYAILIGDEAQVIANACDMAGFKNYEKIDNFDMATVISDAHAKSVPGSVILLSPASASFGLFKDYSDRGDQFIAAVNAL
jgi:UDP-N-acetylmuramoylalanine--D-glutamate ligase